MSEPEVKFEIDEHGRIGYRVTNEGVLLSKDEKEFIIDHVTRMQAENAKLRELVREYAEIANYICEVYNGCGQAYDHCKYDPLNNDMCKLGKLNGRARELGIEVEL